MGNILKRGRTEDDGFYANFETNSDTDEAIQRILEARRPPPATTRTATSLTATPNSNEQPPSTSGVNVQSDNSTNDGQ